MNRIGSILSCAHQKLTAQSGILLVGMTLVFAALQPVAADIPSFPNDSANHWAYQTLADLAQKGIMGASVDANRFGRESMNRFEFASAVSRLVATVQEPSKAQALVQRGQLSVADLNSIQVLVDAFRGELIAMGADTRKATADVALLRSQLDTVKKTADRALATAAGAYGVGIYSTAKCTISGYVQIRAEGAASSDRARFPEGTSHKQSTLNGNYGQGGNSEGFALRRMYLRLGGQETPNLKYAVSFNFVGNVNGSGAQASTLDAYGAYTFGDGSKKNLTLTAGQFPTPFGYLVPMASSVQIAPERPSGFSPDTTVGGLFPSQDWDRGAMVSYGPGKLRASVAVINGNGRVCENSNRRFDNAYRVAYAAGTKWSGGVSYYDGALTGTGTGTSYTNPKRKLHGVDLQYQQPTGAFGIAEYMAGTYEQRQYFKESTSLTALQTEGFVPGNKIATYYVLSGYTWSGTGSHPFTLAAQYDWLNRSASGVDAATALAGGASGSSFVDENVSFGSLYFLDKLTRVRVWYTSPLNVAHAAGSTAPDHIGFYTAELQFRY
ncbi:MAG TPA: porin [Capsulimonadaceae bacterium]